MTDRPILFSDPMVRAILAGHKTMTRRVVKPQPPDWCDTAGVSAWTPPGAWEFRGNYESAGPASKFNRCPYLPVSETRLWVRETWGQTCDSASCGLVCYRADRRAYHMLCECDGEGDPVGHGWQHYDPLAAWEHIRWRPSIHMPRWASRITLQLTSVRAERLQEITEADAAAEGLIKLSVTGFFALPSDGRHYYSGWNSAREGFRDLWDSLNAKRGFPWDSNPWVFVLSFERVEEAS